MAAPIVSRLTDVRPGEGRALAWSFLTYFFLLSGYYILRAVREAIGIEGGVRNLPWLMQATLVAALLINPAFSALAARIPRTKLLPRLYLGVVGSLLLIWCLMTFVPADSRVWIGRGFYIWISVLNLFLFSMFWSLSAERFSAEQGKRLFGIVAAGGSLGALVGSGLTSVSVEAVGRNNLLFPSAFLFLCALASLRKLLTLPSFGHGESTNERLERPLGGSAWAGILEVVKSPYLLGICLYLLPQTISATWVYLLQADIVDMWSREAAAWSCLDVGVSGLGLVEAWTRESAASAAVLTPFHLAAGVQSVVDDLSNVTAAQTAVFANMDFAVNALSLVFQLLVAGRIVTWLGVGVGLAVLPILSVGGFAALWMLPSLSVLVVYQVARRSIYYGVAKPAREALYTVLTPEQKYKAKNFMDMALYRGGDALGSEVAKWVSPGATAMAGGLMSFAWIGVAFGLGKGFGRLARRQD